MSTNDQIICVKWEGPLGTQAALNLLDEQRDYGLYQIYGAHPVYGPHVLLYVGKAREQAFGIRLEQELDDLFSDTEVSSVYVGRIAGERTLNLDRWRQEIDQAEQLLIYSHIPAYNSQSITSLDYERLKAVRVISLGNRGSLAGDVPLSVES